MNEQSFLNDLFERINRWLIQARSGERMELDLYGAQQDVLNDYCLRLELRRCFKTIWTTIKTVEGQKLLCIEHITKEAHEERSREDAASHEDFQVSIQSIVGFTQLIRYIHEHYKKPIVGE